MAATQRQEYAKSRRVSKLVSKGDWELLHEDIDFFSKGSPGLLSEHILTDLDGSETHLSHQIGVPAAKIIGKRSS